MSPRTAPCTHAIKTGRLRKAEQFFDAASTIHEFSGDEHEIGDAYVTLLVHAGIAAADVICCDGLGEHARGESHGDAVALLRRIRPDGDTLAAALQTLLGAKTRAGYGHQPVTRDTRARSLRSARALLLGARSRRP